ncbi:cytochrome b5-related protein-like [Pollicipes pollicipes]|uniref:cytochrome b5-related protein-like n=1 Tax=Pollicipes pollicipes TaxID=41117 RepID=UPI001884AA97|nr:cytochrome b5-related protein-like [Pollicipes pollicipes]
MTGTPERLLAQHHVRAAHQPRNAPYTFLEDGFYRTLKRRAAPVLRRLGTGPGLATRVIADTCVGAFLAASAASVLLRSPLLALAAGGALMLAIGTGHNFLHQRDNWRMFYLDLSFLSSAEWRVSHALSHHMFPNTLYDLEVTQLEPLVLFFTHAKSRLRRGLGHLVLYHIPILLTFFVEGLKRTLRWLRGEQRPRPENILPLLHLLLLTMLASLPAQPAGGGWLAAAARALPLWALTHASASYLFLTVGFAAAHHHPSIFHDGDVPLASLDWGLQQLDAVGDRKAVRGSLPLVLTLFGDHGLHHMFPTVDHAKLASLYGVFEEVCAEFGVRYRYFSLREMFGGQYQQMVRSEPRCSDLMPAAGAGGPEVINRGL